MTRELAICPECAVSKHGNCDGSALDLATDEITRCYCPCNDELDDTVPMIPPALCGVGGCVYLPHRPGTVHSWAPPKPKQRPGETILDAERRERRELASPGVVINYSSNDPTDGALVAEYLAHHAHRWAYLTAGGQECVICGARR